MIPQRIIRLSTVARPHASASARYLHSTSVARVSGTEAPGRDPRLSQGSVRTDKNRHPGDVHDQAARAGQASADKSPLDAASRQKGKQTSREGLSGNPEGVGFAEQVGGASSAGRKGTNNAGEGAHGTEEATPPGFLDSVKSALGFSTTSGEVKQNRGGGEDVTGTGTAAGLKGEQKQNRHAGRAFHTSACAAMSPVRTTSGQAPEASRRPKDRTHADQNEHLKHREETGSDRASKGMGNSAENPSHKFDDKPAPGLQRRTIHTSARRLNEKHTAESYFKDVDHSPPQSSKTHQVDSSDNKVVTPNTPNTGEFSNAGPQSKEYQTVDKNEPYDTPAADEEQQLKYGGTSKVKPHAGEGNTVSKPGEGPDGASAGGRRPERK